jgi:hypothetical protein
MIVIIVDNRNFLQSTAITYLLGKSILYLLDWENILNGGGGDHLCLCNYLLNYF